MEYGTGEGREKGSVKMGRLANGASISRIPKPVRRESQKMEGRDGTDATKYGYSDRHSPLREEAKQ
jgi:hypothetical protein